MTFIVGAIKTHTKGAANIMINKADMGANEVEAWLRNRVAPVITENQLRGFLIHASDLERMRIEHQLEALRE